jgi:hypothetical protein
VDIVIPFAKVRAVAFCAQLRGIIARDLLSTEIHVGVAVLGMMAVETEHVSAVVKNDVSVGALQGGVAQVAGEPFMTHRTLDGILVNVQLQWPQLSPDGSNVV